MRLKPSFFALLGLFFAVLFIHTGCGGSARQNSGYFDLQQFMDGELNHLWKAKVTTVKAVFLNGKNEQKNNPALDSLGWHNELGSFYDADINKSAYVKRYGVDTIKQGDTITIVDYKALDDKLRTRELKLYFKGSANLPNKIEAWLKSDKIFYHSSEYISYSPAGEYTVEGKQDVIFAKADTFAVHARFVKH